MSTPLVIKEANHAFPNAAKKKLREAGISSRIPEFDWVNKGSRKLRRLVKRLDMWGQALDKAIRQAVEDMYQDLADKQDPRLIKLRDLKGRKSLMPEEMDRTILAQAATIASLRTETPIYFLTADGDFYEFSAEIESLFGLHVISAQDIPSVLN